MGASGHFESVRGARPCRAISISVQAGAFQAEKMGDIHGGSLCSLHGWEMSRPRREPLIVDIARGERSIWGTMRGAVQV